MRNSVAVLVVLFAAAMVLHVPDATAQFGIKLPKAPSIPGINKDKNAPAPNPAPAPAPAAAPAAASNAPKGPAPEVTGVTPNVIPPGWEGTITITGKNFQPAQSFNIYCPDYQLNVRDMKVENPSTVTFRLSFVSGGDSDKESRCNVTSSAAVANADINASKNNSVIVVQLTSPFMVSDSSPLPRAYTVCLVGEGKMTNEQFQSKAEAAIMKQVTSKECVLSVSATSARYGPAEKPIFDVQRSGLKAIEGGESVLGFDAPQLFQIVTTDGKRYVFWDLTGSIREKIKTKLKL